MHLDTLGQVAGGLLLHSVTDAWGVQSQPRLLFDRQFVSAGNSNGKGALAFRTSAALQGTLSATALDEDSGNYAPIWVTAFREASSPKKYIAPVVNGDTN